MAHIKKRFKGWIFAALVFAGIIFMLIVYGGPTLKGLFKAKTAKALSAQGAKAGASAEQTGEKTEESKIVQVVVHKAAISDFEDVLPAMGTIRGNKEIELRFEVNGVLDAINFKEGDFIKRGDVVAVLNQQDALLKVEYSQSKLKTAQTQMLTAKKKLEIHQKLYGIGSIIKSKLEEVALEYENAKSQITSAEKEVAFAKQEVQKAYLVSPIDGVMGAKDVEAGEFVTSNTKIAVIVDISNVFAEIGIIERDIPKIALGQEAKIIVDAYPDTEFKGVIDNVLPMVEGKSRTITCKVKIDNASGKLLPGMFARGSIYVFSQKAAIVLPSMCLRDKNNDNTLDSAFVVDQDNIAHLKDLQVGYLTTDNVVVTSGIEEGDMVVSEARGELQDGGQVEILETQEGLGPAEQAQEEGKPDKEIAIH